MSISSINLKARVRKKTNEYETNVYERKQSRGGEGREVWSALFFSLFCFFFVFSIVCSALDHSTIDQRFIFYFVCADLCLFTPMQRRISEFAISLFPFPFLPLSY